MQKDFVLICWCGVGWTQRDIDDYNDGSLERAMERHRNLWGTQKIALNAQTRLVGEQINYVEISHGPRK